MGSKFSDHDMLSFQMLVSARRKRAIPHGRKWTPKSTDMYWSSVLKIVGDGQARRLRHFAQALLLAAVGHEAHEQASTRHDDYDRSLVASLVAARRGQ